MDFRILGPVSAERDGHTVPLDGAKQRATLAALLLAHGQVITDERLTTLLWGWDPPATSTHQLYTYVSRLRTRLGPGHGLTRHGTGYRMDIGTATVDWDTFRGLVETGRADLRAARYAEAERGLAQALALWHGPALGDVTEQLAAAEGPRLEEARLAALEHHTEAALALGRHADLVPGLTGHVGRHPLRERLRGQLMTALYRCGRQADALALYEDGRRLLAGDLGIDPGPELRALHQSILTATLPGPPAPVSPAAAVTVPEALPVTGHGPAKGSAEGPAGADSGIDPAAVTGSAPAPGFAPATGSAPAPGCADVTGSSAVTERASVTESGVTAGPVAAAEPATATERTSLTVSMAGSGPGATPHPATATGHVHPAGAPPRTPLPGRGGTPVTARPPAAPADFTGRVTVVEEVLTALRTRHDVVITGAPGSGTSAVALKAAEQCQEDFPDGQLYADLRTGDGRRRTPHEVLGWFLRALGTEEGRLPADADERAGLFRTLAAGRRMLIVLDNAADDTQVRPLLPGGATRTVVIGVHPALASLEAVRLIRLGPLTPTEAATLLASVAGAERLAAEPEAALRVAEFCDLLPLALRIAGARLATRPHWPVARLADRLASEERRIRELTIGGLNVTTGLRAALDGLPAAAAAALGVLAAAGMPCLTALDAAALLDRAPDDAEELLDQLADAQLLQAWSEDAGPQGAARYRLMPLVRLYAEQHHHRPTQRAPMPVSAG
ncbi:BTAD domain-containing putative transcriptional regulator [Streptomyces massasporeus]|uniref:AfsR/SARP family transcriptional regulator n=1 Tax=Streptomyces massasporeus TaxID=67324 RepID=UPI0038169CFF